MSGANHSDISLPTSDAVGPRSSRRVFVVAGMHRAGTSILGRALQALGVDLGDRLMAADVRMNARGFYEDLDIVKLDDALLDILGADWKSVALLHGIDWDEQRFVGLQADAEAVLGARFSRTATFGFKDPRIPRILPFWQRVFARFGADDAYVIAVRHPLSVIDSLVVRDRLDVRRSGWLWLTHLLCALRYTMGKRCVVVDYDRMLDAPRAELERIGAELRLDAAPVPEREIDVFTAQFLSTELRHAWHADAEIATLPSLVQDAYRLAQRLARGDAGVGSEATKDEIGVLFARLLDFAPLLDYAGGVERFADEVPRLEAELAWARDSFAESKRHCESLEQGLQRSTTYVSDLEATLARKEAELVAAHAKLAQVAEHVLGRFVLRETKG